MIFGFLKNIFTIELYLLALPALLLWNFCMVYPNLQFLWSSKDKKILNYQVYKRVTLCLEVILCLTLVPSLHYLTVVLLVGMSFFLEYKITEES